MIDFPKQYKDKNKNNISKQNSKPSQTKKSDSFSLDYFPFPLTRPLHVGNLYTLSIVDFFRLYFTFTPSFVETLPYSYRGSFSNKPLDRKTILKQKKQTVSLLKSFGFPWDFSTEYSTLSESFTTRVKTLFSDLVHKEIIQESYQIVQWSTQHQSAISDNDISYITEKKKLYTLKYFVSTKNNSLDIEVLHPEFIFADVAIAIHPANKKAKLLKGQEVIIPIINKKIPIILDDRVDFAANGGVRRITPAHDALSLAIAKDHNLPLDIYAVDELGYFTEHAGTFSKKKVSDFFDNIIQNLSDIGNLIATKSASYDTAFCTKTGEKLFPRSDKGWFISLSHETLTQCKENPLFASISDTKPIGSWCVSSSYKYGLPLPVWKDEQGISYIFDEDTILKQALQKKYDIQDIFFSLLLFHLVSDGHIPTSFDTEQCIEALFSIGFAKDTTLFDSYLSVFSLRYPEYKKELEALTKKITPSENKESASSYEKDIENLVGLLENSFLVRQEKLTTYTLDFSQVGTYPKTLHRISQTFEYSFLSYLLLLDRNHFFDTKTPTQITSRIVLEKDEIGHLIRYSILGYLIAGILPRSSYYIAPSLNDKKGNRIQSELPHIEAPATSITDYSKETLRLHLLAASTTGGYYDASKLEEVSELIANFWNCCRYIKTNLLGDKYKGTTSISLLQKKLEKKHDSFHVFDCWILAKTKTLVEEFQDISTPEHIGLFLQTLLSFVKNDLSNKYLELIKSNTSPASQDIGLFVGALLVKLFFPYIPTVSTALRELMELEGSLEEQFPEISLEGIQKNYLISLFMDLVDKFSSIKKGLNLKKHDSVSLFIRSNPDFLRFTKSNENLLKKVLHAEEIFYFTHNEKYPSNYSTEEIIDITIGLKDLPKQTSSQSLPALQKLLIQKEEYLQHTKLLLQSLSSNGADPEVISKKKEDIQSLKDEIEELTLQISKMRIS